MTAIDKANELIVKVLIKFERITLIEAKKIVLIAVDEIIKVCPYIRHKDWETLEQLNAENIYFVEFWQEVQQEIEKL
jgi:hypothetical protein